jgi:drug/metabolite transporter (DMT)-like permease
MGIKRLAAFFAIYVFWGGSFLAIRYVVQVIPPFLAAGIRYSLGGAILFAYSFGFKRQPLPNAKQTINAITTGIALLTVSYGVVYWAETRLDSWIVAVLVSTLFLWTYLGEVLLLRMIRLRTQTLLPVVAGLAGMPLLLRATFKHGQPQSMIAAIAVLLGAILWAATTLGLKRIELPRSYIQTAALQLSSSALALLCISCCLGERSRLPHLHEILSAKPLLSMAYLVIASSIFAFAAFHWLMARESASRVATSAYVNPVVAMLLGIVVDHERLTRLQFVGALVILGSIASIWYLDRPKGSRPVGFDGEYVLAELSSDDFSAASMRYDRNELSDL